MGFSGEALSTRIVRFGGTAVNFECDEAYVSDLDMDGNINGRTDLPQQGLGWPDAKLSDPSHPGSTNLISDQFVIADIQSRLSFNWKWIALSLSRAWRAG